MEFTRNNKDVEDLNASLNDPATLADYKRPADHYRPSFIARFLAGILIGCGNLFYGQGPSYLKFRAIEVIARVPYHSWSSAVYTLLTLCYFNEKRAMNLSRIARYAELAQENETMHVVVITALARAEERVNFFMHTLVPIVFAFFYFWTVYWLYLISKKWSYEINYVFESHAFHQYDTFIKENEVELKKKPAVSAFLLWYGRTPANQYEFFRSVRNDEVIHRDHAFRLIEALTKK